MIWIKSTEDNIFASGNEFSSKKGEELKIGSPIGLPIYGFGCAISEICARAVLGLDEEKQNEILNELFGENNCAFNYCRLSVGANDFADSWYSYDETDGDYELKDFSIERDRKYIIPFVKKAQKLSKDLYFCASPWSPPTWMKFPKIPNGGKLVQTPENLSAYARYLRKFIDAYAQEGIKVKHLNFQNEFTLLQKWPSCVFDEKDAENFIANYLLDEIGDSAEVWYGTINNSRNAAPDFFHHDLFRIMQNEKCRKGIKGASFQWAGKSVITRAYEDFPDMNFACCEIECRDADNSWDDAMYMFSNIRHYFRFGCRATVYWNMALENGGLSTWEWAQNSLISVKDGNYRFNYDFYFIKHFAKYVKPGARFLKTEGTFSTCCAFFQNPDGGIVGVMLNPFEFERTITIGEHNFILSPRSVNTVCF